MKSDKKLPNGPPVVDDGAMSNQFPPNSYNEYDSFPQDGFDRSDRSNAWGIPDDSGRPAEDSYRYGGFAAFPGQGELSAQDDRTFAMVAALSGPAGMLFSAGWLGFAGPLIVWLIYKGRSPFLREQSAAAFNFQLGMTLLSILSWVLVLTVVLIPVSVAIWIAVFIFSLYHPIRAAMNYSRDLPYRYPFSVRILG